MGDGILGNEAAPDGILSVPPGVSGAWLEWILEALRRQEEKKKSVPPLGGVRA